MLDKVLDKIKEIIGIEKFTKSKTDGKTLIDTGDKLLEDITFKML